MSLFLFIVEYYSIVHYVSFHLWNAVWISSLEKAVINIGNDLTLQDWLTKKIVS